MSLSERAWQAYERSDLPKYYWDFGNLKKAADIGQPFTTPPLPTLYGLDQSLDLILQEGLENVLRRHAAVAQKVRSEVTEAGFELLVSDEQVRSDTVTAVRVPDGVDAGALLTHLKNEYGVELAGCPGNLSGKVFRIGHMGCVSYEDVHGLGFAMSAVREDLSSR